MKSEPGRILAVDPGEVRIGLAVTDALRISAHPLKPLRSVGPQEDAGAIARAAREHEAVMVIVGFPLLMSGEEGNGAAASRRLVARLRGLLRDVTVELWDERLTTLQAERLMVSSGVQRRRRRDVVDGLAAVLILQSYLDSAAGGSETPA